MVFKDSTGREVQSNPSSPEPVRVKAQVVSNSTAPGRNVRPPSSERNPGVARSTADGTLPDGWEVHVDKESQQTYFFSPVSGVTQSDPPTSDPIEAALADLGNLRVHCRTLRKIHPPGDSRRTEVRDGTRRKMEQELGLRFGRPAREARALPPFAKNVCLFKDNASVMCGRGTAHAGGTHLLGRFDVVAAGAVADFDSSWKFIKADANKKPFWVLHAAALNIGESEAASDFPDYSNAAGLDVVSYVEDTGHIFDNIFAASVHLKATDIVMFPFGMGAFLRNLWKLDSQFSRDHRHGKQLLDLRWALAARFIEALCKAASASRVGVVHLCLFTSGRGDETDANTFAFLSAVLRAVKSRQLNSRAVQILLHADALGIAQNLADEGKITVLVNGANRALLGNHWFSDGARMAIDENLHRRSWRMAATAYILNGGAQVVARQPNDLADAVRWIGGTVITVPVSDEGEERKQKVIEAFKAWDVDNDGRLSKTEMTSVLGKLGIGAEEVDMCVAAADANNDGFVSYVEFARWLYSANRPNAVFLNVTDG